MNHLRRPAENGRKGDGSESGKEVAGGEHSDLAARRPDGATLSPASSAMPRGSPPVGMTVWPRAGAFLGCPVGSWSGAATTAVAGAAARLGGPSSSLGAVAFPDGAGAISSAGIAAMADGAAEAGA
uniref:Uncharacterized protein n=1 Tax=Arundo donax TaxID=35708 RepID=A0A0A9HRA0_ARUDO